MGNVCSCCPCCPGNEGYGRVGDVDPDNERTSLVRGKQNKRYDFEQKVLDEHVMTNSIIKQAAIFSYKNGDIRATAPRGFNPDRVGIKNILRAMKGIDSSSLAENGINLGSGTRVSTPGKLDRGKAIYGSDGQGGGCTVFKANECVLIVFFDSEIAQGTRLASEVAEYMSEQGY